MNHRRLWIACLLVLLTGCVEAPVPVPITQATVSALTPTPTAAPTPIAPAPLTPTPTPGATATSVPTPTAATAQLPDDVSYCARPFGAAAAARFSARLAEVRAAQTDLFDQVIVEFADLDGVLHGSAACLWAAAWPTDADLGRAEAPGRALIALQLDDWAHDELFAASFLTETLTISGPQHSYQVAMAARSLDSRGAWLGIGLPEPRPFRVRVQGSSLIVELARDVAFPPDHDPLGQPAGTRVAPDPPLFFIQRGDVYRLEDGQATPVAETPELETDVAVSPDGTLLAVCRAPATAEPFALPYGVRATLWTMRPDGTQAQLLADVGGCAEPAFAASGRTIAFTANAAVAPPAVLQVWTVPVIGGEATPVAEVDEWSRSQPQWLADGRLLYRAESDAGQSILLLRESDGSEREVTARMLSGSAYRGVGRVVVEPRAALIAVEALRAEQDGADLVLLRADGTPLATEQRGYWQRPLGFADGDLIYLMTDCPSGVVAHYTLYRRTARGSITQLLSGASAASLGAAQVTAAGLVYVRVADEAPGMRGPAATPTPAATSSLWLLDLEQGARAEVYRADGVIEALARR